MNREQRRRSARRQGTLIGPPYVWQVGGRWVEVCLDGSCGCTPASGPDRSRASGEDRPQARERP